MVSISAEQGAYSIYDLGFTKLLVKPLQLDYGPGEGGESAPPEMVNVFTSGTVPQNLLSGEIITALEQAAGVLFSGKTSFTDTTNGYRMGIDTADDQFKFTMGTTGQSIDWNVTTANTLTITGGLSVSSIDIGGSDATSFHVDTAGNMWLGAATFAAAPFNVSNAGALAATSGTIGGFTIGATTISATNLTLTSGAANTANITVGTGANAGGINSANAAGDIIFWGGDTFANRATADFTVTAAGAVTGSNITITGGSVLTSVLSGLVGLANTNLAAQGWTQTSVFSVTDLDTVAWGAGTFTSAAGTSYSIGAGNTGNMVAKTYIYLDIAVSTTAYQTTTTNTTATGAGKVLIATAQNATGEAIFTVLSGAGGQNIDASSIVANSITANEIAASTITGGNILTMNIAGKNATFDTGTIGGFTMSATQLTATNFSVTSGVANTARVEVGTGANTAGVNSANASGDIAFWAGDTFANRATAPYRVTAGGAITATTGSFADGITLGTTALTVGNLGTYKNGVTTKDLTDASGNQVIAHGLGRTPKKVKMTGISAFVDGGNPIIVESFGAYDGTNTNNVFTQYVTATISDGSDSTNILFLYRVGGSQAATVAVDATNITLTWTKTLTPTGTANILWEVE